MSQITGEGMVELLDIRLLFGCSLSGLEFLGARIGGWGAFCTHCLDFVRRLMSSQHCGHVFGRRIIIIIIIIYYLPGETGRHMGTKRIWDTQLAGAKCGTRHARTGKHSTFLGGRLSKVFFYLFITFGSLFLFQPAPPCLCQCQRQCRMAAAKQSIVGSLLCRTRMSHLAIMPHSRNNQ
jgi:hypothetical protein